MSTEGALVFRPPARRITVRCKLAGGSQLEFDVDPGSTVSQMKQALSRKMTAEGGSSALCLERLRLISKGRCLPDDVVLRDAEVVAGCKLLLLGGGAVSTAELSESPTPASAADDVEAESADVAMDVVREWHMPEAPADRLVQEDSTRCWTCSKKIGLTGVQCRCGYWFCSEHRYAECHDCDFDHQSFQRSVLYKQLQGCVADKVGEL
mmetsp:Transcript_43626/g.102881  ORF Transcript_43626/g.102881 Transcript_43626/m.102881 type:complete len:208 (-) Transcript_43626:240-863(-)